MIQLFDVICAGQAVLDCITRNRETTPYKPNVYRAESIRLSPGGDAVNEARALSGMGVNTAVVCGLGKDLAGDIILDTLRRAGVHTGRVCPMAGDTPIANLQVAEDGSRISINSGATRLEGLRIDPASVKGARIVSLASIFRPPLDDYDVIRALVKSAKAGGAIVCADTKLPLYGAKSLDEIADILPLIDYLFPNEKEAEYYSGMRALPEMAKVIAGKGIRNVVIKAGPAGCFVRTQGYGYALPAVPLDKVVDTTGAGDNFVAGFIWGLLQGWAVRECAEAGLRQAASAIGQPCPAAD